jgi:hypothetical protein
VRRGGCGGAKRRAFALCWFTIANSPENKDARHGMAGRFALLPQEAAGVNCGENQDVSDCYALVRASDVQRTEQ